MKRTKPDRRRLRTQRLLQTALTALMAEKPYEQITIRDILDRANVGRTTFYAHYQDKQDLLLRGVAGMERKPAAPGQRPACLDAPQTISTQAMFTHVSQNKPLHEVMFRNSPEQTLRDKGTAFLYANLTAQLQALTGPGVEPPVPIPLLAHYLTGGLMSLVKWWMDTGRPYSPQEMDALFQQIALPGLRQALGAQNVERPV